ncbi:MAG: bifunctional (p)ppGpp synthetase/guanosine-3',5'-bis(diphosphate) 3'-pyrophosphohydrolase [Candidatus Peribacteraceae bacterium]|nr:bifunctional (p)ppGpp synthetase/guanosine-3',5'-bis(diphosphate) 3'-pyrophosphohydrolase [Candidatus Peribacteraceae bacterium]
MPVPSPSLVRAIQSIEDAKLPVGQQELRRAIRYAEKINGNAMHWTGVTLLEHALGVLQLLLPLQPDADTVTACILQHALESKAMSPLELQEEFGPRVRSLVAGVHLLSHVNMRNRKSSVEDLRLMLLTVADDIRILLIILCKRCFALERIAHLPPTDGRRVARDVLNLFAPVAARLGIHTLKQRLEHLAFPLVYASDAERIAEQLEQLHGRYGPFLAPAAEELRRGLAEQGITASVTGREKLPYSIFRKMTSKSFSHIESLPDLFALRVIVESEDDCYRVLGALHRIGRPVTNRFKDYIAFPKPNGYQSLHTTVSKVPGVPEGVFVEVQVRTRAMNREAEYGIAAHWSYKEGGSAQQSVQRVQLQQALASQHSVETGMKSAPRLVDHIFVLTPKGDVVELPEGATPLDFAFQIHTDVGIGFRAARVNGSIVSLDYELENGDVVEIVTQRASQATSGWLQLLKMASSRSRLKRYLLAVHQNDALVRGKQILVDELKKRRLPKLDSDLSLLRLHDGKPLTVSEREDLLVKLGQGTDKPGSLIQRLDLLRPYRASIPAAPVKTAAPRFQRKDSLVDLEGDVPMPMKFAKCCKPQDDDHVRSSKLIGIITRSGDVMIHGAKCKNATRGNPERRIGVKWRKGV